MGIPLMVQRRQIQLGTTGLWVPSLASLSGLGIRCGMSCGVGHRHGLDLELLWLWYRLGGGGGIRPGAWELACAWGVTLKMERKSEVSRRKW